MVVRVGRWWLVQKGFLEVVGFKVDGKQLWSCWLRASVLVFCSIQSDNGYSKILWLILGSFLLSFFL